MGEFVLYISSFQNQIHICTYDAQERRLKYIKSVVQPQATFLTLSADRRKLYVGCENFGGHGGIAVYDITEPLEPCLKANIEEKEQGPGFMSLTGDGQYLLACSYFSGDIKVYQLDSEGLPETVCCHCFFHTCGTAFPKGSFGQAVPRAHCIRQLPESDLVFVTDYSGDRLVCFLLREDGNLEKLAEMRTKKGEAPRHIDFHPIYKNLIYLNTEFSSCIYVIRADLKNGEMECLNRYDMAEAGNPMSSAIKVSPDGNYLYNAKREKGTIDVYQIEAGGERLEYISTIPDVGYVRDYIFTPDAEVLISGNQENSTVQMFEMNWDNGMCAPLAGRIEAGTPASFAFGLQAVPHTLHNG